MADTYVKKILAAIIALVDAAGKPAGLTVSASRVMPTPSDDQLKHIAVYPVLDVEKPGNAFHNPAFSGSHRLLTVAIECRCAGTDQDNETLRAWAYGQVMSNMELGGLARQITEDTTEWQGRMDSTSDYSQALLEIVVEYARKRNTLESS
jgi:hypothetical protein